jgi:hypothetical protein
MNTHAGGFFENVSKVASYLIKHKEYPEEELLAAFSRFLGPQVLNPMLMGTKRTR